MANSANNQKVLEDIEKIREKQDMEKQQLQEEINNLREQVGSLVQLLQMQQTTSTSSLEEEVVIICNMHGSIRVTFPTWNLQLTEFGEKMTITKAQLQELVNTKRSYFKKQYILVDAKYLKIAESLRIPVYDSHSKKFIKPEDLESFATMSTFEIEQYYNNLSKKKKKTFVNYFYDKCCAGEPGFYTVDTMNTLNRLTKSRIFDNLITSCAINSNS